MKISNLDINVKKILAVGAGVFVFTFTGCGKNISSSEKTDSSDITNSSVISLESNDDNSSLVNNEESTIEITSNEILIKVANVTGVEQSELYSLVERYSLYTLTNYFDGIKIVNNSLDKIKNEYNSPKAGIMCVLFDNAIENGTLKNNCNEDEIRIVESMPYEQESFIIDMCNNYGMSDDERNVTLSIFRTKLNTTTSPNYWKYNNFDDSTLPNGELCKYQTPKYGLYEAVAILKKRLDMAKDQGIYGTAGLINYLSQFYGDENWIVDVTTVLNESYNGYPFGEQKNVYM